MDTSEQVLQRVNGRDRSRLLMVLGGSAAKARHVGRTAIEKRISGRWSEGATGLPRRPALVPHTHGREGEASRGNCPRERVETGLKHKARSESSKHLLHNDRYAWLCRRASCIRTCSGDGHTPRELQQQSSQVHNCRGETHISPLHTSQGARASEQTSLKLRK